jgi:hypothetical protein
MMQLGVVTVNILLIRAQVAMKLRSVVRIP